MLSKETSDYLANKTILKHCFIFHELDSTNNEAMRATYPHYSLIIAEKQHAGKGRSGRKWVSNEGNLYFSIVLPPIPIEQLLPLNITTGYAICDALRNYADVYLKWPNDIVSNHKKLGGILIETKFSGNTLEKIVLGIGINVNQSDFSDDIKDVATSLAIITGQHYTIEEILLKILNNFENNYTDLLKKRIDIIEKWCKYSMNFGKRIKIHLDGKKMEFIEKGITESGELVAIDHYGNERKIVLGDIYL
ncbi:MULTISPECIES: biotin--[acetyl-CoA-carboxylase] ligase [Calditerrivibrio]|uniref:Biotin--[acetyl-CoA-carboxylase] ligase n=1 Tax=Calditerrivibrio nitroreducens TaxID=477976 RepID=A0A2J6WJJ6_9BACT|nr:MAG: biotin--[acetyl-CoA-carboxylase] ligase [Calditerrivibrio nitroreducens]